MACGDMSEVFLSFQLELNDESSQSLLGSDLQEATILVLDTFGTV